MAGGPLIQRIWGAFNAATNALIGVSTSGEAPYSAVFGNAQIVPNFTALRLVSSLSAQTIFATGQSAPADGNGGFFSFIASDTTSGAWFTGTMSGSVLTVISVNNGTLVVGQSINRGDTGATIGTISSFGTGAGGVGTYNISAPATIPSPIIFTADSPISILVAVDGARWYFDNMPITARSIPAPGSGVSLTINGANNFYTTQIIGGSVTNQSFGLFIEAGTTINDIVINVVNRANTIPFFRIYGDGSGFLGWNGSANTIQFSSSGNVVLPTPVGGTTLTVNGVTGGTMASFTDGTTTFGIQGGGPGTVIGTTNSSNLNIVTNNATRAVIDTAGHWVISSATGGNSIAVTAAGGTSDVAIQVTSGPVYSSTNLGVGFALDSSGANFGLIENDAANTWSLAYGTSKNSLGTPALQWNTTPQLLGRGPVAAALVDMTPDKSTFTGTFKDTTATGTTATVTWSRVGNLVTLNLPNFVFTSQNTDFFMTGLPASLRPATLANQAMPVAATEDNGAVIQCTAFALIQSGSGTITFFKSGNLNNTWTNSGNKGIPQASSISYLLN